MSSRTGKSMIKSLKQTTAIVLVSVLTAVSFAAAQEQTINENAPASHGAAALPSAAPTVSAASYGNIMKALSRLKPAGGTGPSSTGAMVGDGSSGMPLHHLPPHPLGTRLVGESDSRTWPFYAGAARLGRPAIFRLSYLNAVSVMPEGSFLEISINGEPLYKGPIFASTEAASIDIEIPPQLLALGYNAITVKANQRHRVDCTPDAKIGRAHV